MSPSFDLLTQPWLPCLPLGSDSPITLSLPDALADAHHHRELVADSPLVAVALHRLLLAVLHRAYMGPRNAADWNALWAAGYFDAERVSAYLTNPHWRTHFDLFDARRPFYQVPALDNAKPVSIAKLSLERASGNNITLFDHSTGSVSAFTPAEAARYLATFQLYAMPGGISEPPVHFTKAPLALDYTVFVRGNSLFETLMLNLLPYDDETYLGRPVADDSAWWERDHDPEPDARGTVPRGYCDYLTWQSRRVHLDNSALDGNIRTCEIRQNLTLSPTLIAPDPFKAYRQDKQRGLVPRWLSADKAVWRDSHALLEDANSTGQRPEIFQWLAALFHSRRPGSARAFSFEVIGYLINQQGAVILWRRDRLPLPLAYLAPESKPLRDELQAGLQTAEEVSRLFRTGYITVTMESGKTGQQPSPLRVLARHLLTLSPDRTPDGKDITNLANHFAIERTYWASLETRFQPFMLALAADPPPDSSPIHHYDDVLTEWKEQIRAIARRTFETFVASLESDARSLRAAALAQRQFNWLLNEVLPTP